VKIIFQPAEEGLGGASRMLEEGVLENPVPDLALALHLWNEKPIGWLGISDGPVMSASETFRIIVRGKGGHGGIPQETIDPIMTSAKIINSLQSLVSREMDPLESAVVSVCSIQGGSTHNVIPEQVVLEGTIRTFSSDVRLQLLDRFQELVKVTASANLCQVEITFDEISEAVVNDPLTTEQVRSVARELYPDYKLIQTYQTTASEDMAVFLNQVPGCYFFIGSANPEAGLAAKHHQPDFNFDEEALKIGTALLVGAAEKILS
jgi:amidohydrolase